MPKKEQRVIIVLACGECKRQNYTTTKNKQTITEKLALKKYCRWCKKHTLHSETKIKKGKATSRATKK